MKIDTPQHLKKDIFCIFEFLSLFSCVKSGMFETIWTHFGYSSRKILPCVNKPTKPFWGVQGDAGILGTLWWVVGGQGAQLPPTKPYHFPWVRFLGQNFSLALKEFCLRGALVGRSSPPPPGPPIQPCKKCIMPSYPTPPSFSLTHTMGGDTHPPMGPNLLVFFPSSALTTG